jgi:hypothetical protein
MGSRFSAAALSASTGLRKVASRSRNAAAMTTGSWPPTWSRKSSCSAVSPVTYSRAPVPDSSAMIRHAQLSRDPGRETVPTSVLADQAPALLSLPGGQAT